VISRRVYRRGFLALVPAVAAMLFAVEPVAEPLPPGIATTAFDGRGAAAMAREIESLGEARAPGSEADTEAARLVTRRFREIPAGVITQTPTGDDESPIVAVTLPGEVADTILVLAPRTAGSAAGRLATATATGVLAQLAGSLGDARHENGLVFASTPDAAAATELARQVSADRRVIGSISIDDARGLRTGDVLLHRAPGDLMASSTLAETTRAVIGGEGIADPQSESALGQIARLAVGLSFGTQSLMLSEGIDAIALSATGERPPRDGDGAPARVVSEPVEIVGEIALRVVQALDAAPELPDEAGAYVLFGDDVVPRWAFALLGLALLAPALAASTDALARAARRGRASNRALQSVLARSLPFAAAAGALYLLATVGIVPDPAFPFDPGDFDLGTGELLVLALLAAVAAGVARSARVHLVGAGYGAPTLAAAAGLIASLAVLGVWLSNPFAALAVMPLAHVWLVAAGEHPPSRLLAAGAIAVSLLPLGVALNYVADRLDLGSDAPWTIAMVISGGQLRLAQVLLVCALGGALLSVAAASRRRAPR
jgi:hypothetical protein